MEIKRLQEELVQLKDSRSREDGEKATQLQGEMKKLKEELNMERTKSRQCAEERDKAQQEVCPRSIAIH